MRFNISQLRSQLEYAEKEKRSERLERSAIFKLKELGFERKCAVDAELKHAFNCKCDIHIYAVSWIDAYKSALNSLISLLMSEQNDDCENFT